MMSEEEENVGHNNGNNIDDGDNAFIDDDCDKLGDDDDIDPKTSIHLSVTKQDDCDNALQCSDNVE